MTQRRSLISIFLLATAVMVLEVALTRVFSFITYHHMTYLVIGVAMLGFGAAGTFITVRGDSRAGELSHHAALFAASVILALLLIPRVRFGSMTMYQLGTYWNLVALLPLTLVTAIPFFFGGVGIALLVSRAGPAVNRIYFADLAGSAAGSVLAIVLVNSAGAIAACVAAAAIAALAGAVTANAKPWRYARFAAGLVAFMVPSESPSFVPLRVPPGKQLYGAENGIEHTEWHVITRLDVGKPAGCSCSFGGSLSKKYPGPEPQARLIFQDGSNLTGIVHPTPTPAETPVFGYYLQGAPYVVRPKASGLVIGSGGGIDVMVALHHGASHVVAVDVNPKTMALVRGQYADFAGRVFERPDVEPVVSEGRHFLSRDARQFDVIQLSGVDTWAAQAAGAYALTENFIYTEEAFDQYLAHLRPDGLLGFSRPYVIPALETYRLIATALSALERTGAATPSEHILVVAGHGMNSAVPWAELLVKRSPFTPEETAALVAWTSKLGFDVVYDPHGHKEAYLAGFVTARGKERAALLAEFPLEVSPVTDDAPFYFQHHRWRDLLKKPLGVAPPMAMWVLVGSFFQVIVLSVLLILYPLYRSRGQVAARGGRVGLLFYFGSLGMGFILVEIALLQKLTVFLGGPAYALSITLCTLLLASGLGSFLSDRAAARPVRLMTLATPALVAGVLAQAFLLDGAMQRSMSLALPGRALVAVAFVAPLGLVMGMLFPAGLRYLDAVRPELKPWAWGINGCATVVGTATCMLLVSAVGFRAALLTGAAVYVVGWLGFEVSRRLEGEGPAPGTAPGP